MLDTSTVVLHVEQNHSDAFTDRYYPLSPDIFSFSRWLVCHGKIHTKRAKISSKHRTCISFVLKSNLSWTQSSARLHPFSQHRLFLCGFCGRWLHWSGSKLDQTAWRSGNRHKRIFHPFFWHGMTQLVCNQSHVKGIPVRIWCCGHTLQSHSCI